MLGPNGAGKTTTFKCMLGLARPTSGEVRYDGKPLVPESFERIAYVPERSVLYDWLTVDEHVEMNRRAYKNFDPARARELLTQFGVDQRQAGPCALQRHANGRHGCCVRSKRRDHGARRAHRRPRSDQSASRLEPDDQRGAQGNTIIFSSHQIGQVERAAERIAIMDRGALVLEGLVDDLKADRKIVEGIFGDTNFSLDGIANDPRVARADRTERIVRLLVTDGADEIATRLGAAGATGIRVLDLNLEDIFLYAVSPAMATADVVAKDSSS